MATREIIKQILVEWSEFAYKDLFLRDFDYSLLDTEEILTIIGPRRAGKTCLCYQLIRELQKSNKKDNIIFINLEDERLYPLNGNELAELWNSILEVFDIDLSSRVYLFIRAKSFDFLKNDFFQITNFPTSKKPFASDTAFACFLLL